MSRVLSLVVVFVSITACTGDEPYDGPNRAPVANAGGGRTGVMWQSLTLDGSGSRDPDGDAVAWAWEITSAPAGSSAVLAGATTAKPTLVPDRQGEYHLRLRVSDGTLESEDGALLSIAFGPPPNHVAVYLVIDDTANQSFTAADGLTMKGGYVFDPATRVLVADAAWSGPHPVLWDDGAWTAGGHEPAGETAGDHRWGVATWVSNTVEQQYDYIIITTSEGTERLVSAVMQQVIPITSLVGSTVPIERLHVVPLHGNVDVRITVDVSSQGNNLFGAFRGHSYSQVQLASPALNLGLVDLRDDGTRGDATGGDEIYTVVFSEVAGPAALVEPGGYVRFQVTLDGQPYLTSGGWGSSWLGTGIAGAARSGSDPWTSVPVVEGEMGLTMIVP